MFRTILILLLLCLMCSITNAQDNTVVKGMISDEKGKPLEMVQVIVKEMNKSVMTNSEGYYQLELTHGDHTLVFMMVGYKTYERKVSVKAGEVLVMDHVLKFNGKNLDEVEVSVKSDASEVQESPYSVTVIDTKPLKVKDADINKVLNSTAGIRVREDGGMGSDFNFSLNGFSGNQVKFFLDGVPMDNFGSSLSLNNVPINLVDRIEVYKGVVPVFLGSDALGGAINVVTNQKVQNFLDASYSFGSFNQHRAAITGRFVDKRSGFTVNVSGFYNYADNNYSVDVKIPDPNTGKVGDFEKVKRFHDGYNSKSVQVETGFMNTKFADKLLFGLIVSGNYKEIQSGLNMTQVAGEVYTTDKVIIPTFKFLKKDLFVKGLSLSAYANYNIGESMVCDTSSKKYDWRGNYKVKTIDRSGELSWDKTLFRFNDRSTLNTVNLTYRINHAHSISLSNTYSWYRRTGEDPLAYNPIPFSKPNILEKSVSGLSYGLDLFDKRWSTTVFGKVFNMSARVSEYDWEENKLVDRGTKYSFEGYGIATTFFICKWMQLKASYENTYRLPESYELFGNGLLLLSSPDLLPEQSQNMNTGFLMKKDLGKKHQVFAEGGYLYRLPKNLIRLSSGAITGQYENLVTARVNCWEAGIKYIYNKQWSIEANGTYQDMINTNQYEPNGAKSLLYLDRLPNIPFLFGNASIGFMKDSLLRKDCRIMIDWSSSFVEAFYLKWPSQGAKSTKYDIPRQFAHQVSVSCSFRNGQYNVSLACTNVTNARIYDNFMMQKPGRALNIKLSYFIAKQIKSHNT